MATHINQYKPNSISHPGSTLAEKLQEMNMGSKEFAVKVNKPEKTISAILNGKSSITSEMAVNFESVLKIPASFWLNRQKNYDEYAARLKQENTICAAFEWVKEFPYSKMASFGWVEKTRKMEEKVVSLFNFFGVSNHLAWENYYYNQELKVSFRISLAHTNEAHAVSAWLRKGELQANEISLGKYDEQKLRNSLVEIKKIMAAHLPNFFDKLQQICAEAGVKVVYTPCLPKVPVNGATRWIGDNPLIQLSARYKTNDKFWFTFFHEIGHILLHGKKHISIENIEYDEQDLIKEREADDFSIKYTFSEEEEKEVMKVISKTSSISSEEILNFAKKFGTHPALIIGRFHHKQLLPYNEGREFIESIDLTVIKK